MAKLKVPSVQHLARNWRPTSAGVRKKLITLAKHPPQDHRFEGRERMKTMTLPAHEFIRRFLIHVLPKGLHRIRHYGLVANTARAGSLARMRELLAVPAPAIEESTGANEAEAPAGAVLARP